MQDNLVGRIAHGRHRIVNGKDISTGYDRDYYCLSPASAKWLVLAIDAVFADVIHRNCDPLSVL